MTPKQKLRDRIAELETLNGLAARELIELRTVATGQESDIEQLRGAARLAQLNFDEERADARARLECLAEIERMVFDATHLPLNEQRTLVDALREIIDHRSTLISEHATLSARDYERGELVRIIAKAHADHFGDSPGLTPAEQLVEYVDGAEHAQRRAKELGSRLDQLTSFIHQVYFEAFGSMESDLTPQKMLGDMQREIARAHARGEGASVPVESMRASENVVKSQRKALERIIEIAQGETL